MIKIVDIDLYHTSVVFLGGISVHDFNCFYYRNVLHLTDEEYKSIIKDIENPKACNGLTAGLDNGGILVYVRHPTWEGDVAHEIFHAANKILTDRGFNLDEDGEPWAYLIGYLTDKYYEALSEEYEALDNKE